MRRHFYAGRSVCTHSTNYKGDSTRYGDKLDDWPPDSPDLNPIENLWAIVKAEMYRLRPELLAANNTEETLQAVIRAAHEAWHGVEDRIIYNLCVTMPHRVQAVIEADGWYTKY